MGKTSFASYVGSIAYEKFNLFPIYVNNEGTNTIDDLIGKLLEKLVKEFNKTNNVRKFINDFFKRIVNNSFGNFIIVKYIIINLIFLC